MSPGVVEGCSVAKACDSGSRGLMRSWHSKVLPSIPPQCKNKVEISLTKASSGRDFGMVVVQKGVS